MKPMGHSYFSNIKTYKFESCIRSEPIVIESTPGFSSVNDNELTATNMTRYLIFNRKLQVIYRGKQGWPTVFPRQFFFI